VPCCGAFHSSDAESLFIQVEDHHWSTRKHAGEKYSKDVPLDEVKLAEIEVSVQTLGLGLWEKAIRGWLAAFLEQVKDKKWDLSLGMCISCRSESSYYCLVIRQLLEVAEKHLVSLFHVKGTTQWLSTCVE